MENFNELIKYAWMAFVAFLGGTVGFITKISPTLKGHDLKQKLTAYGMGLITSMFVAYVVYEVSLYLTSSERLAIALAGLASFAGTDLLVICQQKLIETVKRKFDKI